MNELSLHILDIIQNSIVAGAKLIGLTVAANTGEETLSVEITDDGCGMTPEFVEKVISPFTTTRTTRKVGLGIPMYKQCAESTGGFLQITSKVGEGTRVLAVFGLYHIDRPPMGELNETVLSLIACNPELDFVFTESRDGQEYILDTRELREALGPEVPLNLPDVIGWIRADIEEGTQAIHGGAESL